MAAAHPFGAFIGCQFKRIRCVRQIKVNVCVRVRMHMCVRVHVMMLFCKSTLCVQSCACIVTTVQSSVLQQMVMVQSHAHQVLK